MYMTMVAVNLVNMQERLQNQGDSKIDSKIKIGFNNIFGVFLPLESFCQKDS